MHAISLCHDGLIDIVYSENYVRLMIYDKYAYSMSRFHTYDYARHFVSACTRILGLEGTPEGVEDQGRLTRVAAVCPHVFVGILLCPDITVASSPWLHVGSLQFGP